MVCPWFRVGGQVVRTIAMVARFDHIGDVTLDELRVELMYPLTLTPNGSSAPKTARRRADTAACQAAAGHRDEFWGRLGSLWALAGRGLPVILEES